MSQSFRDLQIWSKGYDLALKIYFITKQFPKEEKFGLTDQIRRSSNSVIANIAEAHGRYHYAVKCRVLYQARGECFETQNHLSLAYGLHYIKEVEFTKLDEEYEGLGVGINAFISKLRKT